MSIASTEYCYNTKNELATWMRGQSPCHLLSSQCPPRLDASASRRGRPGSLAQFNRSCCVKRSMSLSVTSQRFATSAGQPTERKAVLAPTGSNSPFRANRPLLQPIRSTAAQRGSFSMTSRRIIRSPAPWPQYTTRSFSNR